MEIRIKCPDCGKMLKVTVESESSETVELKKFRKKETSWYEIVKEKSSLSIGDEVSCVLKNGENATFVVAAINPYGDNQIAFVTKDCIGEHLMNETSTNKGGWKESEMRKHLNEEVIMLLPDDLKYLIIPRKLKTKDSSFDTNDSLWLLSKMEVFGEESGEEVGDVHFPLFETERDRVKNDEDGSASNWWLRAPGTAGSGGFWFVGAGGGSNGYYAGGSYGVAFGFLV